MQFTNDIFNDLQKLIRYFNGTKIFVFFTELFVFNSICCFFYKSCFIFKQLGIISSHIGIVSWNFISFKLPQTSWRAWTIIIIFSQTVHKYNVNIVCYINKRIVNFCPGCRKWCTIFKCNICITVFSYCYISCN